MAKRTTNRPRAAMRETPVIDAVLANRPFLKKLKDMLARTQGALFDKGGDITLPAQPGPNGEIQTPVTVSVPQGILRDPSNITIALLILYWVARLFGLDPPFTSDDVVAVGDSINPSDGIISSIMAGIAAIFRTKSKNITRG